MIIMLPPQSNALPSVASREPECGLTILPNASESLVERFSGDTPAPDDGTRYVIAWQNKVRWGLGKGKTRYPHGEAEAMAADLNAQYPNIKHWIVEV